MNSVVFGKSRYHKPLENSVVFGRSRYHQHLEMESWCHVNIGVGGWSTDTPSSWEKAAPKIWVMHCMFGTTTFAFKEEKDAMFFILRWS